MQFLKLSSGAIINLAHVVQLTPPGHLQLTSGNVLTLTDEDVVKIEAAMTPPVRDFFTEISVPDFPRPLWVPKGALHHMADEITWPDSAAEQQQLPEVSAPVELEGSARSRPDPAEPGQTPFAPTGS